MNIPKYSMLKADDRFLFTVMCNNHAGSNKCFVHQWSVYPAPNAVTVTYKITPSLESSTNTTISTETSLMLKRKFSILENTNGTFATENSFFSPITYRDEIGQNHIVFFSGGRYFGKGLCGDSFLHDMVIKSDNGKFNLTILPFYSISEVKSPLHDYAAILVKDNLKYYYIIHGGISCDYQTIYSDFFAINLFDKVYIKLAQNYTISWYLIHFLILGMVIHLLLIMESFSASWKVAYIF